MNSIILTALIVFAVGIAVLYIAHRVRSTWAEERRLAEARAIMKEKSDNAARYDRERERERKRAESMPFSTRVDALRRVRDERDASIRMEKGRSSIVEQTPRPSVTPKRQDDYSVGAMPIPVPVDPDISTERSNSHTVHHSHDGGHSSSTSTHHTDSGSSYSDGGSSSSGGGDGGGGGGF